MFLCKGMRRVRRKGSLLFATQTTYIKTQELYVFIVVVAAAGGGGDG